MTTSAPLTKSYNATFILDTRGSEQAVDAIVERLKQTIAGLGGTVTATEDLGRRDFVRVTDKKHPGDFYFLISFTGPLNFASTLRQKLILEKSVKRLLVELV